VSENNKRIDYIEFPSKDVAATRAFYEAVFGWVFTDYGPRYTSFEDGRMTGGFDGTVAPSKGGVLVVLYSSDLEGLQASVVEHGGRIVKEIFSFPGGRRFEFEGPCGNTLAAWSE
jgi:predicted enzyme related to lactoylglutathione lyase